MDENNIDTIQENNEDSMKFKCPNCGNIHRDDVLFLCNKCPQEELIEKDGVFMCPSCLTPGENFQCSICESKEVTMELVS